MRTTTVTRYERTNERVNALLDEHFPDDVVWVVQGVNGRTLITAPTAEEAQRIYDERGSKWNPTT